MKRRTKSEKKRAVLHRSLRSDVVMSSSENSGISVEKSSAAAQHAVSSTYSLAGAMKGSSTSAARTTNKVSSVISKDLDLLIPAEVRGFIWRDLAKTVGVAIVVLVSLLGVWFSGILFRISIGL